MFGGTYFGAGYFAGGNFLIATSTIQDISGIARIDVISYLPTVQYITGRARVKLPPLMLIGVRDLYGHAAIQTTGPGAGTTVTTPWPSYTVTATTIRDLAGVAFIDTGALPQLGLQELTAKSRIGSYVPFSGYTGYTDPGYSGSIRNPKTRTQDISAKSRLAGTALSYISIKDITSVARIG